MLKSVKGSCHCGAIRFEAKVDVSQSVVCDCSLCRKRTTVMLRCDQDDLSITEGEDFLTVYKFNTLVAKHYFCKICGVYTFHKMRKLPDKYAVNAGCLDNIDPFTLEPIFIHGSLK